MSAAHMDVTHVTTVDPTLLAEHNRGIERAVKVNRNRLEREAAADRRVARESA
jgi:hypothetical protein